LTYNGSSINNTKDDNNVDNVEIVEIDVPTTGIYTLTVSHKGNLQTLDPLSLIAEQNYSLIVSGNRLSLSNNDVDINDSLAIYPNPANDYFDLNFKLNESDDVDVTIYDINARIVKAKKFRNYNNTLFNERFSTDSLEPGIYLVNISNGSRVTTEKLVIN
jgi:hypothetical protein